MKYLLAFEVKVLIISISLSSCTAIVNNFEKYQKRNIKDSGPLKTLTTYPLLLNIIGTQKSFTNPGIYSFSPQARNNHTATVLSDGRILIVGGLAKLSASSVVLSSTQIFDPKTGLWTRTASLSTARYDHTATLLNDGRVLVCGGRNASSYFNSAEIYDPSTDVWGSAGSFSTIRAKHTATLLSDDRVLIAGGTNDGSNSLNSIQIYTPSSGASGTWDTPDNNMSQERYSHTATLLANNKVLFVGGKNDSTINTSVEIYNTDTETSTLTNSLSTARAEHSANILSNGIVLVAGGTSDGSNSLDSSEEFDSEDTLNWTLSTTPMNTPRRLHTSNILKDNQIIIIGGLNGSTYLESTDIYDDGNWSYGYQLQKTHAYHSSIKLKDNQIMLIGGQDGTFSIAQIQFLKAPTETESFSWVSHGGSLNTPKLGQQTVVLSDNSVLVTGGDYALANKGTERIYPDSGFSVSKSSMNVSRYQHSSTTLNSGKVLNVGGWNNSSYERSAELYDPNTNTWTNTPQPAYSRGYHTATLLANGKVLIAGGTSSNTSEVYDPNNGANGSWSTSANMNSIHAYHAATLLKNGKVLLTGGHNGAYTTISEIFDPSGNSNQGTWTTSAAMPEARGHHTSTLLNNGKVLVAGGANHSNYLSSAIIYDPDLNTWSSASSMNYARAFHTANLLPDGRVLVVGGSDSINTTAIGRSAEIYNPDTDTWTLISNLNLERRNHNTVVLSDGRAIIVGGEFQSFYHPSFDIFSIYSPVALKISNGVAPFTNFINGAAIANTLAFDTSTRLLFPTSNKSTGIYLQDSNLIRSNEAIITVNP
jgi:N-acetylneuraminic acid mutarotase